MPEGDSIHRLAARLGPVLVDREVTGLSAHRIDDRVARSVVGKRVARVEARGKNLLVVFEDARALHVHLRMQGWLFIERPRSTFWTARRATPDLRLTVRGASVVGHHLPVCRLLSAAQEARAPDLAGLGPDLVREDYDEDEALRRLRKLGRRTIAEALLVQRAVAGIGNVYKSEVLFLEGIDPRALVASVTDPELRAVLRRASTLLRQNLGDGPRTTRNSLTGARHWVYGRGGGSCFRCATPITRIVQGREGGRSTYYCERCQVRTLEART